jgi:hypothetical protein
MADESKDPLADYISVDDALLYWVRDRITLPGFDRKMWTEEHDGVCTDFLLSKTINKLTIIMVRGGRQRYEFVRLHALHRRHACPGGCGPPVQALGWGCVSQCEASPHTPRMHAGAETD